MTAKHQVAPVAVFPLYWHQGPRSWPTFRNPQSFFLFGNPDTGKSNMGMALTTNFIEQGATAIDMHGADNDAETLVWLLSPYKDRVLTVIGNDMKVEMSFEKCTLDEFTMKKAEEFKKLSSPIGCSTVAKRLTMRRWGRYSSVVRCARMEEDDEKDHRPTDREARKVIRSQMIAGMSMNEQDAQEEFIDLNNTRAHSGIAPIVDTQRYMDISTSFRQLCNYRIIKGFGGQPIPDEMDFVFRPRLFGRNPNILRNLPRDEFIALTSWNGVCRGICAKVPWAINKGEDLITSWG